MHTYIYIYVCSGDSPLSILSMQASCKYLCIVHVIPQSLAPTVSCSPGTWLRSWPLSTLQAMNDIYIYILCLWVYVYIKKPMESNTGLLGTRSWASGSKLAKRLLQPHLPSAGMEIMRKGTFGVPWPWKVVDVADAARCSTAFTTLLYRRDLFDSNRWCTQQMDPSCLLRKFVHTGFFATMPSFDSSDTASWPGSSGRTWCPGVWLIHIKS